MSKKIGLLFAGQGAQAVGMGKDLAASLPVAAKVFERADAALGRDLSRIAFDGPDEELTRTSNCQPALYVHGLACLAALEEKVGKLTPAAAAGLSLGEFTAHAAAGTFSFEDGLRLVETRGRLMQEACDNTQGAMAAMIGADENVIRDLAVETDVDVANLNSPGQVVISGETPKVSLAVSLAKERGVRRATMLNVAGAYHSRLMNSAYEQLGEALAALQIDPPAFPVVCNVDATPVEDPDSIRRALQEQVTGTVRWWESIVYMIDEMQVELFIELGPGGILAGLVQRTRKGTPVISIGDAASVEEAAAKLSEAMA